jgi:hypothetical protein
MADGPFTVRDNFLSVFQSAVADLAKKIDASPHPADGSGGTKAKPMAATEGGGQSIVRAADKLAALRVDNASDIATPLPGAAEAINIDAAANCASLGLQYFEARLRGDTATARRIQDEITGSTCDSRWISTLEEYLAYFGPDGTRAKIPYIRAKTVGPHVITIKPGAKIALVGDWGTGADPAVQVLRQIKDRAPDIIIHLGDIYYSGTAKECQSNFTEIIEAVFDRKNHPIPVFSLAGNHDMYSGGHGYYGLIGALNPGRDRQPASFFCLRSADQAWQLLAIDTGLHDYNPFNVSDVVTFLEADEQEWHRQRLAEFSGKTILLSHHPLFSAFSRIGASTPGGALVPYNPRLLKSFEAFKATGRTISAWFWGHEHNLCIYRPYAGLARGRCIGHGAIPVFESQAPYALLPGIQNLPQLEPNTQLALRDGLYAHGFALVSLGPQNGKAQAEYFQSAGDAASLIFAEALD